MLEQKYNAKEVEPKWQKFWEENQLYKFDENTDISKVYSIDTPPPSVSGSLHIGHVFSYTQTEIVARMKRMQGYNVFYPLGFDNNGMPTEKLVEKITGKKSREFTREEFNNLCFKTMKEYQDLYRGLYNRLGFSFDHNYTYSTISPTAQKISQTEFLHGVERGEIYYTTQPSTYCPDCQTTVAQADLEGKEKPTLFNYLNFEIVGHDAKLPIATTRPEMLGAIVCVFVNPNDERYKKYIGCDVKVPLFEGKTVKILADEKAAIDKGTGVVMCCTYGDQTDLEWQIKHNLPVIQIIGGDGLLTDVAGKYAGLPITKARKLIIEDLKEAGYIYKQEEIVHSVNVHERCGTPVEIIPRKQWALKILDNKEEFIKRANQINWYPPQMKARHNNWIDGIDRDWNISRQRYFGPSFPVWHCEDCGKMIFAREEELPVNPLEKHIETCPHCGGHNVKGDTDVMDTWLTSSISPMLATSLVKNEELKAKMHPMTIRPNAHDIIRTWDFYTIVRSHYKDNNIPWKNVVVSGHVLSPDGSKISKSKGGGKIDPNTLIDMYSADIVRYWASSGSLGLDMNFSEDQFKNGSKLINKLYNAARFVTGMMTDFVKDEKVELLSFDQSYLHKFYAMQKRYNSYIEKYEIGNAMNELEKFFWNFCDDYIEIAKNRLYKPEVFGEEAKKSGQKTIYTLLLNLLKLFAPYMPFVCEEIYKNFFEQFEGEISIHKTLFPKEEVVDENLIEKCEEFCLVVSLLRKYKSTNNLSMKAPLENVEITVQNVEFFKENAEDLKFTLSIENLTHNKGTTNAVVK